MAGLETSVYCLWRWTSSIFRKGILDASTRLDASIDWNRWDLIVISLDVRIITCSQILRIVMILT